MQKIKVTNVSKRGDKRRVYDLSVQDNHNFFIDEGSGETLTHNCDQLSPAAQMALRNPMVEYSATTRFILTANYPERIADPIHSRVQDFEITPPSEREAARLLDSILKAESVEFSMDDAVRIIRRHYPDLRKILNTAQRMTSDGVLTLQESAVSADRFSRDVVEALGDTSKEARDVYETVRKLVANQNVRHFEDTYRYMYDNLDAFAPSSKASTIMNIAQAQYRGQIAPDKEINFMDTIVRIAGDIR